MFDFKLDHDFHPVSMSLFTLSGNEDSCFLWTHSSICSPLFYTGVLLSYQVFCCIVYSLICTLPFFNYTIISKWKEIISYNNFEMKIKHLFTWLGVVKLIFLMLYSVSILLTPWLGLASVVFCIDFCSLHICLFNYSVGIISMFYNFSLKGK